MNQTQDFKVGDHVLWNDYYSGQTDSGEIEWIEDDFMSIRLPREGKCEVSISAKKIDGQWLVHRSYQGYKELLNKS